MSSSFPPRCLPPMKIFGTFAIRAIMLCKVAEHYKKRICPRAALALQGPTSHNCCSLKKYCRAPGTGPIGSAVGALPCAGP
jgi:hypothetical protein